MALVKDLARAAAERALDEFWDGSFPVDPVRIAQQLGMSVWIADLPDNESGRIVKRAGESAEIFLARDEPAGRQNFTCAHELGHWFERYDRNDDEYSFVDRRGEAAKDAHEFFADHFAANLLMPAHAVIQAVDDGCSVSDLARRFAVTPAAARTRARHLGLPLGG